MDGEGNKESFFLMETRGTNQPENEEGNVRITCEKKENHIAGGGQGSRKVRVKNGGHKTLRTWLCVIRCGRPWRSK